MYLNSYYTTQAITKPRHKSGKIRHNRWTYVQISFLHKYFIMTTKYFLQQHLCLLLPLTSILLSIAQWYFKNLLSLVYEVEQPIKCSVHEGVADNRPKQASRVLLDALLEFGTFAARLLGGGGQPDLRSL